MKTYLPLLKATLKVTYKELLWLIMFITLGVLNTKDGNSWLAGLMFFMAGAEFVNFITKLDKFFTIFVKEAEKIIKKHKKDV